MAFRSTVVETEIGGHGTEAATFEELVDEDLVYSLKSRPELTRLGSPGLQPYAVLSQVVPSVDLVGLQPTMLFASDHAIYFAWALQLQNCRTVESQHTSMGVMALGRRLRAAKAVCGLTRKWG